MDVLTIQADLDVLNHYHKQKSEFHFQQKSDNDFLMFLLDTAVRVISIGKRLIWKFLLTRTNFTLRRCETQIFNENWSESLRDLCI